MSSNPIFRCLLSGPVVCAAVFATHAVVYAQGNSAQTPAANNFAVQPSTLGVATSPNVATAGDTRPVLLALPVDQVISSSKSLNEAKMQVVIGDTPGAVRKLATQNISKTDTADWHLETTQRLIEMAGRFSLEGNIRDSKAVVTESLRQLDQAATRAKNDKDLAAEARAHSAAGAIQDRYRGDPVSAIGSYQAALRANPADKGAKEALERLQKSYANVLARGRKDKK